MSQQHLIDDTDTQPLIEGNRAKSGTRSAQRVPEERDPGEKGCSAEKCILTNSEQGGYILMRARRRIISKELPKRASGFVLMEERARELQASMSDANDLIIRSPTQKSVDDDIQSNEGEVLQDAAGDEAVVDLIDPWRHTPQKLSTESIYGAAFAMPQIARSAEWHPTLTMLSIRSYFLLIVNFFMQYVLLYQLNLESVVMNYYGSQPHLCNFGQSYDTCPGSTDCVGPAGTLYRKSKLVPRFSTWNMRTFAIDSMLLLEPNRTETLNSLDPGEYGIESPLCRAICVYLFVLMVLDDLIDTFDMVLVLCTVPASHAMWISYDPPVYYTKFTDKDIFGHEEFDYVNFCVQGMPWHWKLLNMVFIVLPKFMIWLVLAFGGVTFLMETAGIQDVVLNSLALAFILEVDELIACRFLSETTLTIMGKLEQYSGPPDGDASISQESVSFSNTFCKCWQFLHVWVPKRLIVSLALTAVTFWIYYTRFCEKTADGSYISKPVYPPKEIERFGPWLVKWLVNPSSIETVSTPTWQMGN